MTGLVPHLPEVLPEALEAARGIGDGYHRARALIELAPHLPEYLLPKPLEIARGIGGEYSRAEALQALTATLTPANVDLSFWENALRALGSLTRSNFLETIPNLAPLILHFGGVVALRAHIQQIKLKKSYFR